MFASSSNEISKFACQSPEREKLFGENPPHIVVLEQCATNLARYGASQQEIESYLQPHKEHLGDLYEKIITQTALLNGASQDLAMLKLKKETNTAILEGNDAIAALNADYRRQTLADMTGGNVGINIDNTQLA